MQLRNLTGTLAAAATLVMTPALIAQNAQSQPKLNDAEVAHTAVTANQIDVDAGKIALSHSKNAEVRKFAETMVRDHAAVIAQASALAKRLGVTPADNAMSKSLLKDAKTFQTSLSALKDGAFDRAYIDHEVAYHEAVIGALDNTLVPSTQNAELKKFLVDARPAFMAHLEHAKMVQKSLEK